MKVVLDKDIKTYCYEHAQDRHWDAEMKGKVSGVSTDTWGDIHIHYAGALGEAAVFKAYHLPIKLGINDYDGLDIVINGVDYEIKSTLSDAVWVKPKDFKKIPGRQKKLGDIIVVKVNKTQSRDGGSYLSYPKHFHDVECKILGLIKLEDVEALYNAAPDCGKVGRYIPLSGIKFERLPKKQEEDYSDIFGIFGV